MMKRIFVYVAALLLFSSEGLAQSAAAPASVGHESISIHLNTSLLLTGESLLFKINCIDPVTGKFSGLSKVAYLELIDEKQQAVSRMKVALENGQGNGTYYVEPALPTGNYTLIAYTRWMRNFGSANFYRKTITLINPAVIEPGQKSTRATPVQSVEEVEEEATAFVVKLDKENYRAREKVSVQITPSKNVTSIISVNVRLKENTIGAFADVAAEPGPSVGIRKEGIRFLPDLRGELISGTLKDKAGNTIANEIISLSAPPFFWLSRTDSTGRFFFTIQNVQTTHTMLKPLRRSADEVTISVDDPFLGSYKDFAPEKLRIDTALLRTLSQRYISSQVQNAFRVAHKDSVVKKTNTSRFIASPDKVYRLDDFTRFPTMDDVFREIIPEVIVKAQNGHYSLSMRNVVTGDRFYKEPLTLIDGVPVTDADVLMRYDPLLIDKVVILARRYYLGPLETEGIISIETYKGNAEDLDKSEFLRHDFVKPLSPVLSYYFPNYETETGLARIPDFRTQLYWNPEVNLTAPITLFFFANDLPGTYQLEIDGITSEGKRIHTTRFFVIGE